MRERMQPARIASLSLVALTLGAFAHAAKPEDAPPESNAQVANALRALTPALGKARPNAAKVV